MRCTKCPTPHRVHFYLPLFSHNSTQLGNLQAVAWVSLSMRVHILKEAVGISKPFEEPDHMFVSSSLFAS